MLHNELLIGLSRTKCNPRLNPTGDATPKLGPPGQTAGQARFHSLTGECVSVLLAGWRIPSAARGKGATGQG